MLKGTVIVVFEDEKDELNKNPDIRPGATRHNIDSLKSEAYHEAAKADMVVWVEEDGTPQIIKSRNTKVQARLEDLRKLMEEHASVCYARSAGLGKAVLMVHGKKEKGIEFIFEQKTVLQVTPTGCFIEGRPVDVGDIEEHDRAVYKTFKQWLQNAPRPAECNDPA